MNANSLKAIYEKLPKSIKYFFAPWFIRLMVKNKEFVRTWKELDAFEEMSSVSQKEQQLIKLKDILTYAYFHVPYYRTLFDKYGLVPGQVKALSDIEVLPLLEKADAVELGNQLYSIEENLKYYKTFTGGSSGQALTVLLDKDSVYRERACVCHYLSKLGYDPLHTKTVAFWGHNKDEDYYYSPMKNEIVISPFRLFQNEQFNSICDDIEKFGATFIMGYPSAIYLFAQMLEKAKRRLKIEHVVYYAENCSDEEKAYIERVFACPVSSYYGHTERAVLAEINENGCVFNDFYGYTELIPTDIPSEYRIVCTGFLSKKMPLIRYATDDVVVVQESGEMRIIGHKRSETYLISKNGQKIFKGAMTLHIEELSKVQQYQYVQNEKGKAELHIVQKFPLSEDEIENIRSYVSRRCEALLDVEIKLVKEVQLTGRGKYIWAINNID